MVAPLATPTPAPNGASNPPTPQQTMPSESVHRWVRLNRAKLREEQKKQEPEKPKSKNPLPLTTIPAAAPRPQETPKSTPTPPLRQQTAIPSTPLQRPPAPGSSRIKKMAAPFAFAASLMGAQADSRQSQQQNGFGSTPDAYTQAMSTVGGQNVPSPLDAGSKTYAPQGPKATQEEMQRQREMRETQQAFTGESTDTEPFPTEDQGEDEESFDQTQTANESEEMSESPAQNDRIQQRTLQREQEQAQAFMIATEQERQAQTVREEQKTRLQTRAQAVQKKTGQQKQMKQISQKARLMLRSELGIIIPVLGTLLALNIECFHDYVWPLMKPFPQEPNALRLLITITLDMLCVLLLAGIIYGIVTVFGVLYGCTHSVPGFLSCAKMAL